MEGATLAPSKFKELMLMSRKRKSTLISYAALACMLSTMASSQLEAFSLSPPRENQRQAPRKDRKKTHRQSHVRNSEKSAKEQKYDLLRESFESLVGTNEPDTHTYEDTNNNNPQETIFQPKREVIEEELPDIHSEINVFPNLSLIYKKKFFEFLANDIKFHPTLLEETAYSDSAKAFLYTDKPSALAKLLNDTVAKRCKEAYVEDDSSLKDIAFDAEEESTSIIAFIKDRVQNPDSLPLDREEEARPIQLASLNYDLDNGNLIARVSNTSSKASRSRRPSSIDLEEVISRKVRVDHSADREYEADLQSNSVADNSLLKNENLNTKYGEFDFLESQIASEDYGEYRIHEKVVAERVLKKEIMPASKEEGYDIRMARLRFENILKVVDIDYSFHFLTHFTSYDPDIHVAQKEQQDPQLIADKEHFPFRPSLDVDVAPYYANKFEEDYCVSNENNRQPSSEESSTRFTAKQLQLIDMNDAVGTFFNYDHDFLVRRFKEPKYELYGYESFLEKREDPPLAELFRHDSLVTHLEKKAVDEIIVDHNEPSLMQAHNFIPRQENVSYATETNFDLLTTYYSNESDSLLDFEAPSYNLAYQYQDFRELHFEKHVAYEFLASKLLASGAEASVKDKKVTDVYEVEKALPKKITTTLSHEDAVFKDRDFLLDELAFDELLFEKQLTRQPDFNHFAYNDTTPKYGKEPEFIDTGKLFMEKLADCGMDFAIASVEDLTKNVGKPKNIVAFEKEGKYKTNAHREEKIPETVWSYGFISDDMMIGTTYEDYDFSGFRSVHDKDLFAFNALYYSAPKIDVNKEYKAEDFYQFAFKRFLFENSQNIATGVDIDLAASQKEYANPNFEKTQFLAHENLFLPDIQGHSLIIDIASQAETTNLPQLLTRSQHLPGLINATTGFLPSAQNAICCNQNHRQTGDNLSTLPTLDELNTTSFESEFNAEIEIIPNTKEKGYLFAITLDIENKKQFERPPQNFIFMVDKSGAIEKNRFQVFKQAVAKSLAYLKDGDTFNIVTFDNQVAPMSKDAVFYSASTKHGAKRYLETQRRSYKYALPDIYDVLMHANHLAKNSELPTTVFLLTNGKTLEDFDTQSEILSHIVSMNRDHFTLFTACASHSNNNLMLEIISNLNKGEFLHSQTHAAFPRKFAAFVKHASHLMANNIHVSAAKSDLNVELEFYPNNALASNLYIDKPYTIVGKIDRLSDFELILQGKFGDQWLNLKKNISFKHARKGGRGIHRDYNMHIAYNKYKEFLKEGNTVCLDEAKTVLKPLNVSTFY
ncbi:MAG: hypothetical protein S4CHLAM37_01080 [Chlamydiia bacterium]|nr:hypothetical protein [Chlamydiia bacterium]